MDIKRICTGCLLLCAAISVMLLPPTASNGHMDRVFTIGTDGTLKGLPSEYNPAYLKISRARKSGVPDVVLRLGSKVLQIPPCIAKLFVLPKGEKVSASGSWYHTRLELPPYLHLSLPQRTHPSGFSDGYELLFNLQTAELISVTKTTVSPDGMSQDKQQIDPSSICGAGELGALQRP